MNRSGFNLGSVFDKHVRHEFEDQDVEAMMKTMVKEPYVHNVATLSDGFRILIDEQEGDYVGRIVDTGDVPKCEV